jgi:hypothetical protein
MEFKNFITEASLSRILSHSQNGFAILTSDRGMRTPKENNLVRKKLEQTLQSMGKGFIRVKGGFIEDKGTEEERSVYEKSFFLPNISLEEAKQLAKIANKLEEAKQLAKIANKFEQEAILYGDGQNVFLLYPNGQMKKMGDHLSMANIGDYFTQWRGRKFTFENLEYLPTGQIDALVFRNKE